MHIIECPQCQTQLTIEDPSYTRVFCTHCREIVEFQPMRPAKKSSGISPRASATRNAAVQSAPRVGSGPRHAAPRAKSKTPDNKVYVVPAAIVLLLLFSLGAFALTRSRSTTQASVAEPGTPALRESTDTKKVALTTDAASAKPPVTDATPATKLAPAPEPVPELRRASEPAPTTEGGAATAAPVPTPAFRNEETSKPAVAQETVAPPATAPEPVSAPAPTQNLADLLKTPAAREQKRDDDEALLEKEDAARAKKAAEPDPMAKDDLRSKLKTEEPAAPPAPPKALAAKSGMPGSTPAPAKAIDAPELTPVCATCMGTGFTPIGGPRHLVRGLKDAPPPGTLLPPWKQCAKCKAGVDDATLAEVEAARMKDPAVQATADNWAQMAGGNLGSVETRHITFRSQLAPAQSRVVADMLEQLTEHLQLTTRVTVLTPTRPETHELFLFTDRGAYEKIRDTVAPNPNIDRAALAKISGMSGRNKSLFHVQPPQKPEHMGLFLMGRMSMTEASNAKAPFWMVEGFAAYCENAITKKNLCYTISYELNDIKFSPNWNDDVRKFALKKQLKPWKDVFFASGVQMKPLEYLTCYSMVSFLIKSDPQRFSKLVLAVREGHPSPVALKLAYGRSVEDLQNMWANWALTAK